jgi:endosialidase-like protein
VNALQLGPLTATVDIIDVTAADAIKGIGGNPGSVLAWDVSATSKMKWSKSLGLNEAPPATDGTLAMTIGTNGQTGLRIKRNTDSSPSGKFFDLQTTAGATLFSISATDGIPDALGLRIAGSPLAATHLSNGVTGSGVVVLGTAPAISGGSHAALATLGLRDTGAAFDLDLAAASSPVPTATRTLTFDVNNAARTLRLTGNATLNQDVSTAGSPIFGGLGLGITPLTILHIGQASPFLRIDNTSAAGNANVMFRNTGGSGTDAFLFHQATGNTAFGGANSLNLYTQGAYAIAFNTNGAYRGSWGGSGGLAVGATAADVGVGWVNVNAGYAVNGIAISSRQVRPGATLYVSTTGSDSDTGLTTGTALATINKAVEIIQKQWDNQATGATIKLLDGTYTENPYYAGFAPGGGYIISVTSNSGSAAAVTVVGSWQVADGGVFVLSHMTLRCTTGPVVSSIQHSIMDVGNITFGTSTGQNLIVANNCSNVNVTAGCSVNGNAASLINASGAGTRINVGANIAFGADVTFSGATVLADEFADVYLAGFTLNGHTVTGTRWGASRFGQIVTDGTAADTFIPGSVAGAASGGGGIAGTVLYATSPLFATPTFTTLFAVTATNNAINSSWSTGGTNRWQTYITGDDWFWYSPQDSADRFLMTRTGTFRAFGSVFALGNTAQPPSSTGMVQASTTLGGLTVIGPDASTSPTMRFVTARSDGSSTFVMTLPQATDTLVGKATTDTLTNKTLTSPTINGGVLTALTTLALRDSVAAFDITIASASSADGPLTAGRTLTLDMGNADHVLRLGVSAGTLTFPVGTKTIPSTADTLAVFAATTSAQLLALLTNPTGTGLAVFSNTPSLTTPDIGAATGASLNASGSLFARGNTTQPASSTGLIQASAALGGLTVMGPDASTNGTIRFVSTRSDGSSTFVITLPKGTTDFTATGGTSRVVMQASAGAALTVAQLAASDLSNGVTGSNAVVLGTAPTIAGGSITALTTFALRDTSAAFDVTIAATSSSALTAGRTLTLDLVNSSRTLKIQGTSAINQDVMTTATPTFAGLVVPNINPGADFTLTNNSVAAFTSVNAGAVVNTLVLKTGFVGMGIASPTDPVGVGAAGGLLHLAGTKGAIHLTNSANGTASGDGAYIDQDADGSLYIYEQETGFIEFGTTNTARWRIGATGGLHSSGASGTDKGANTINVTTYYAAGVVGVTQASAAVSALATTAGIVTTFTPVSDERLKAWEPYTRGLAEVRRLQSIRYRWNDIALAHDPLLALFGEQYGWRAKNLQEVAPEVVGVERWDDGREWLTQRSDRAITAMTINAVQELDGDITTLKDKIDRLTARLAELESRRH